MDYGTNTNAAHARFWLGAFVPLLLICSIHTTARADELSQLQAQIEADNEKPPAPPPGWHPISRLWGYATAPVIAINQFLCDEVPNLGNMEDYSIAQWNAASAQMQNAWAQFPLKHWYWGPGIYGDVTGIILQPVVDTSAGINSSYPIAFPSESPSTDSGDNSGQDSPSPSSGGDD